MNARAFRSKNVLVDGAFRPATVIVGEDGRIAEVEPFDTSVGEVAVEEVAFHLLPGLVDTHVHINEPGRTEWEGFETATRAAASGGVTTLVDMPLNCIPVTTSVAALEIKRAAVRDLLSVDLGFWGGVVPGNAGELKKMAELGMLGAKCFLCHSGIDDFPKSEATDLRLAMPILRDAGIPLLVHAELELPGTPSCDAGDVREYGTYLASRPREWEDNAIEQMIALCEETGCAVHIVHLSSATALPMIQRAKEKGLPFTAETCPHYLCLSAEEVPSGATEYKCSPPIREAANRELLWRGLSDGVIDFVTSDHSPCTPHLKKPEEGDFCGAWGGIASLSLGLPSVWRSAHERGLSLAWLVTQMSAKPAQLARLHNRKGKIAKGFDADLCAFDPEEVWSVDREGLQFRHHVSPYVGRPVRGRIKQTWLRGECVFDGKSVSASHGRLMTP